jgi:hypothetical protein
MGYQLRYREELPPAVIKELDDMVASYNALLSKVLNEDGSLNWPAALGLSQPKADQTYNPPNSPLLNQFLQVLQSEGQRWKSGPWTFEDTNGVGTGLPPDKGGIFRGAGAGVRENAAVRAIGVASGAGSVTYDNYIAVGTGGCVALEFSSSSSDVILTGLDPAPLGDTRRALIIGNTGSSGKTLTLKNQNAGSLPQNRFKFEDATDIVLSDGQYTWIYYSPSAGRWIGFVTGNKSGGLVGTAQLATGLATVGSDFKTAYRRITNAEIKALLTTAITVVAAQGTNTVIEVQSCSVYLNRQVNYANNPSGSLRYAGDTTDITNAGVFLQTSATPGTRITRFSINSSNQAFDASTVAVNKDVVWRAGQDNTLGDAANFLDVFVTYRVYTVIP